MSIPASTEGALQSGRQRIPSGLHDAKLQCRPSSP